MSTKNKPTSSADEISTAIADKQNVEMLDKANRDGLTEQDRKAHASPLTANDVEDRIEAIVVGAGTLFYEAEQRILATNGKAYPIDWDFGGRDYDSTEELTMVDKYGFLDKQFARLQCSGLEMLLRQQNENIGRQRTRIQNELRFGRNAGADVAAKVESMADWLANMIEQAAMIEIALKKAVETFALSFGETYITKEQAAQVAESRKASLGDDTTAKLAKLGVALS